MEKARRALNASDAVFLPLLYLYYMSVNSIVSIVGQILNSLIIVSNCAHVISSWS